jgi:hypothetical protein
MFKNEDSESVESSSPTEGLYIPEDGKNLDHRDRMANQEKVSKLVDQIFQECGAGAGSTSSQKTLSFDEYSQFNKSVSSEAFLSLMALLHDRLPCAPNVFRLKRMFRR